MEAAMVLSRSLLGHLQLVVDSPANSGFAIHSESVECLIDILDCFRCSLLLRRTETELMDCIFAYCHADVPCIGFC